MSSVSDNFSLFRNSQDSSNTYNDIIAKLKRNRTYLDKEDDERIVNVANRKHLIFKRFVVEQNTEKTKSFSSSDFHFFSQSASADETSRKNDVTRKLNEKLFFKIKKESF